MLLDASLSLAERGLAVFPCKPRAKVPATADGYKSASRDPALIRKWWGNNPAFNVAVATGAISNVFVLDVDGEEGEETLARLEKDHGPLPATVEALTAAGRHFYFRLPTNVCVGNSVGRIGPHVDTRGDGGYVVAPPSVHPCGRPYAWSVDGGDAFLEPPAWLLELVAASGNSKAATSPEEWRTLAHDGVAEGERNTSIARLAGHLLRRHVDPLVTLELALAFNDARCRPPLPENEVAVIIDSIAAREMKRRRL
jgi:hypothetical protein